MGWEDARFTQAGVDLIRRCADTGANVRITSVWAGNGVWSPAALDTATRLADDPKQELPVVEAEDRDEWKRLYLQVTPVGLAEGYQLRQIGIWARGGETETPVLMFIMQDEEGFAIPSAEEMPWFSLTIAAVLEIDDPGDMVIEKECWIVPADGTVTRRKLAESVKVWRNIAGYVPYGRALTSDTIEPAFAAALEDGAQYLYIPAGEYTCNLEVHGKDVTIMMDSGTVLRTDNIRPALRCEDCSVTIIGGEVGAGSDYTDRTYVYPLEPGEGKAQAHGIIELTRCHDCSISGLRSRNSNYPSVIQLTDCLRVDVERCDFRNGINSFIHIISSHVEPGEAYPQSGSIRVANCSFVNVLHRVGIAWCYAVYTGAVSLTDNFMPPDGLIYENNYVYNTEDCALDTHGATNVIMRNNYIRQVVCALTAYNDNRRVVRPEGWNMNNVLIENNYVESDKSPSELAYQLHVAHPLIFTGASNTLGREIEDEDEDDTEIGNVGNFHEISGVTIRNNYFKTSSTFSTMCSTNACCANLTVENNIFDLCGSTARPMFLRRCINFRLSGNTFLNATTQIRVFQSFGEVSGNEGLRFTISQNSFSYVKGAQNNKLYNGLPQLMMYGDSFTRLGAVYKAINYGLGYRDGSISANVTTDQTCQVADGVATVPKNIYVPDMAVTLTDQTTGTKYSAYIRELFDFNTFSVTGTNPVPDGTYTIEAATAVIVPDTAMIGTTVKSSTTVRETPDTEGTAITTLSAGDPVICDYASRETASGGYTRVFVVVSGTLRAGYILSSSIVTIA